MAKRKQIAFDIDTNVAKEILGEKKYTDIYAHIRRFMEKKDWQHIEGSVYMSSKPMDNADIFFLIKDMKKQYPYLDKCVKEMHQTDISKVHSLDKYFKYDGTPGKYAQIYEQKESNHKKSPPEKQSVIKKLEKSKESIKKQERQPDVKDRKKAYNREM